MLPTSPAHSTPTVIVVEEPLLRTQCTLGEGAMWDSQDQTLHFIDIYDPHLYHYKPVDGSLTRSKFTEPIGSLALRERGGLACAAKRGYGLISETAELGSIDYLAETFTEQQLKYKRFNDGACDAKGRFWAGTLEYETAEGKHFPGELWKFDPETKKAEMIDNRDLTDSNAIGWSVDHKTMYFVNSTIGLIYAYDYELESGTASNRRIFVDGPGMGLTQDVYGKPDGFCIDKEGCIWSCRWEGSRIVRFTPDGKGVDLEIHIPKAFCITSCCFGGPNLDKLFITSASCGAVVTNSDEVNAENQKKFPCSGDVFMVDFSDLSKLGAENHPGCSLAPGFTDSQWRYTFPL